MAQVPSGDTTTELTTVGSPSAARNGVRLLGAGTPQVEADQPPDPWWPTGTQPAGPQPGGPQTAQPQTAQPQTAGPQAENPHPRNPQADDGPLRAAETDDRSGGAAPIGSPGAMEPFPEFAVVIRGFDRSQVDAYIGEQRSRVQRAETQAAAALRRLGEAQEQIAALGARVRQLEEQELSSPPPSIEALGRRITRILDEAWSAANELQADARRKADEAIAAAAEVAASSEAAARQRATEILEEAEQKRRSVLRDLQVERDRLQADTEHLRSRRDQARQELGALQSILQQALMPVDDRTASEDGAGDPEATTHDPEVTARSEEPETSPELPIIGLGDAPTLAIPILGSQQPAGDR